VGSPVLVAMGYGMLVSVLGRNKGDFDGLLAFYHMFTNRQGLMNWQLLRRRSGEVRAGYALRKLMTCSISRRMQGCHREPCTERMQIVCCVHYEAGDSV